MSRGLRTWPFVAALAVIGSGRFFGVDSALIGTDGVHPTDAGHEYMGELLAPAIAAALPAANRVDP